MKFKGGDRVRFHKFNDFMVFSFTSDGRFTLASPIGLVKIELDKKINKILSI